MAGPCAAALVAGLFAAPAFAAAPGTVMLEGMLTSSGGGAAADGVYGVTFRIYDAATGGNQLWIESTKIQSKAGQFSHALGSVKPLDAKALASKSGVWIGMQVGTEPEMARAKLHSSLFARWAAAAGKLECAGCIGATHIASGAVGGTKVGFNYAGSDTKGGSALKAKTLSCTGCVTVAQLKFDKNVDLGAVDLKTTGIIAANQFIGDGSNLTGIKTPAGTCSKSGEVVKGIDANGKLICVKAMDPTALPSNGLNEISNQALSNEFNDVITGGQNKPIPDFNSNGLLDTITVPDIGNADSFEVYVEITKEPFDDNKPADGKPDWDTTDLTVLLFPPTTAALKSPRSNYVSNFTDKPTVNQKLYPHYVLHQQTGKGFLKLVATYPTKTKPVFGDIHKDWLGKNPKGTWQLLILDNQDRVDNKTGKDLKLDGKLVTWHIKMSTTSGNQVLASGQQFVNGKLWGKYNGHDKVQKGGTLGGPLQIGGDLQVGGGLRLGDSQLKCEAKTEGILRYSKAYRRIEYCNGRGWTSLANGPSGFNAVFRWAVFDTYTWPYYWHAQNNADMFGGINPSHWTDGNYRAVHLSSNTNLLVSLLHHKAYAGYNATVVSDHVAQRTSTNGRVALVAFRVRNTTGKAITWYPYWYFTAYTQWNEYAGVAINGKEIWAGNCDANTCNRKETISIPPNRTSTVVFNSMSSHGYHNGYRVHFRGTVLAFYNNSLKLPQGLVFVDDLEHKTSGNWSD